MIRLKAAKTDFTIVTCYPPPVGDHIASASTSTARWSHQVTALKVIEWAQDMMWTARERSTALLMGDLNATMGLTDQSRWKGFGEWHNRQRRVPTSEAWYNFFDTGQLVELNSRFKQAGPTFYHESGSKSTLDRFILLSWALDSKLLTSGCSTESADFYNSSRLSNNATTCLS